MPRRILSPLPIDLLNLIASFVGDSYSVLRFELTPNGYLSHHRIWMQFRTNSRLRSNKSRCNFAFENNTLLVHYGDGFFVREQFPHEYTEVYNCTTHRYIVSTTRRNKNLANKFAGNIARLSFRSVVLIWTNRIIINEFTPSIIKWFSYANSTTSQ